MKQTYLYLIEGKSLFLPSIFLGGSFTALKSFFLENTPSEVFGYSLSIWFIALVVNAWDIHTGVKADIKTHKEKGEGFKFNPDKGWKAFEKIFGFTVIIGMIYRFELEAVRLGYPQIITTVLNAIKSIFFFYVILIELQSIGNNNEVRFGQKGKLFKMLDSLISIADTSILDRFKKLIN